MELERAKAIAKQIKELLAPTCLFEDLIPLQGHTEE